MAENVGPANLSLKIKENLKKRFIFKYFNLLLHNLVQSYEL